MIMAKRVSDETRTNCSRWLEGKYIEWRNSQPIGYDSIADFARLLDLPRSNMAHWIAGDTIPENGFVTKLANRLGSEIYDILGWERPKEQPPDVAGNTSSDTLNAVTNSPNTKRRKQIIQPAPDNAINILSGGGD